MFDAVEGVLVVEAEGDQDLVEEAPGCSPGGFSHVVARGEVDGDDDGGDLSVARCLAQRSADGLDDVDGAGLGVGEQHGVDGGNVDAFAAAPAVSEDRTVRSRRAGCGVEGGGGEGGVGLVLFEGGLVGVDGTDVQQGAVEARAEGGCAGESVGEGLCGGDGGMESEGAAQVVALLGEGEGELGRGSA